LATGFSRAVAILDENALVDVIGLIIEKRPSLSLIWLENSNKRFWDPFLA
jgi:hypothetical protein